MTTQPSSANAGTVLEAPLPPRLGIPPITWAAAGAVAKWVGEKAAGGLVSAAVGKAFTEFMDAVGMGGPNLAEKLDKISDQIVEVQRSLDRLTQMTEELLKQMAELREFMEKSLKLETLIAAMDRIDVAYGKSSSETLLAGNVAASAISLRLLVEKMPHFQGITPKQLEDAAIEFASYVSDIPDKIETIHTALAKAAFNQTSLLDHWAKELGQQVKARKMERDTAYLVLEGYFLQAVSVQLKGVSVHCVALSTKKRLGPQFVREFLQDNFAKTMAKQTAAFVAAVELMLFTTVDPQLITGLRSELGEGEFPSDVDELLLRADLIAAALNLIDYKTGGSGQVTPSLQTALQGIYGRALLRPSDLSGETPPAFSLEGYSPAAGKVVRALPFPCIDLILTDGKPVLRDIAASATRAAHYRWTFRTPAPAKDIPLDRKYRGGVTPKLYPVFGADQPPVLAASLLDVSRLFRGLPASTAKTYTHSAFSDESYVTFRDQRCTPGHHALTNEAGTAVETFFSVFNIFRASTQRTSKVIHPLFTYSGARGKARFVAHIEGAMHREPRFDAKFGTAFGHRYEVTTYLRVRQPNGVERTLYDSPLAFGHRRPLSVNEGSESWSEFTKPYDGRGRGYFAVEIDLEPGHYEMIVDNIAAFAGAPERYEGWHKTSLGFYLHGAALERVIT